MTCIAFLLYINIYWEVCVALTQQNGCISIYKRSAIQVKVYFYRLVPVNSRVMAAFLNYLRGNDLYLVILRTILVISGTRCNQYLLWIRDINRVRHRIWKRFSYISFLYCRVVVFSLITALSRQRNMTHDKEICKIMKK